MKGANNMKTQQDIIDRYQKYITYYETEQKLQNCSEQRKAYCNGLIQAFTLAIIIILN
jgi:hypothetical protein